MNQSVVKSVKTKKRNSRTWLTRGDKIYYAIVDVFLFLVMISVILPILYVVANSFSSGDMVAAGRVFLWPKDFSLEGYTAVFNDKNVLTGYKNTIFYASVGTVFNLLLTILAAWPLSRRDLPANRSLMLLFVFTMLFSGGLIPDYLLVKNLGIMNTRLALILPKALNVYNMAICCTFFRTSIPKELLEAAQLDGCSEIKFFAKIVLPLSKAVLAVIALYYAVWHWNTFFNAFLYLTNEKLYPLQLVLRGILLANQIDTSDIITAESLKYLNRVYVIRYALILVASVPIWCVYPFVQKYFVQGVMIGSIKG